MENGQVYKTEWLQRDITKQDAPQVPSWGPSACGVRRGSGGMKCRVYVWENWIKGKKYVRNIWTRPSSSLKPEPEQMVGSVPAHGLLPDSPALPCPAHLLSTSGKLHSVKLSGSHTKLFKHIKSTTSLKMYMKHRWILWAGFLLGTIPKIPLNQCTPALDPENSLSSVCSWWRVIHRHHAAAPATVAASLVTPAAGQILSFTWKRISFAFNLKTLF